MSAVLNFFISYNHRDELWAEWIAWHLEDNGYTVRIQAWDFKAGGNFVLEMQRASAEAERTIAVLSPSYVSAEYTQPEWAAAFAADPTGSEQKLLLVRVIPCEPKGLLAPMIQIRLDGLTEIKAKERLLAGILQKRSKPNEPPEFPGKPSASPANPRPHFPGAVPPIWNVPFPPNPFFTGRTELLDQLDKALAAGAVAAVTQPAAIHGLGGVGKTQLVAQYLWLHRAEYDAVMWVTADSPETVNANFIALSSPEILNLPEANEEKPEVRLCAVKAWLRTHDRWILAFDTADSREAVNAIRKLIPIGLSGHVIITSRLTDWPLGFDTLIVEALPESEASSFLTNRTTRADFCAGSQDDALRIAQKLGCLPLALEQAAAYIVRHRISMPAYEALLDQVLSKLLAFPSEGGTSYQKTVATTWQVTVARLSEPARAILRLVSFFAPSELPRLMFSEGNEIIAQGIHHLRADQNPPPVQEVGESTVQEALGELSEYSLIHLQPIDFTCHRLLQAVELASLDASTRVLWNELALQLAINFAPSSPDAPEKQTISRKLFPHVRWLLEMTRVTVLEPNAAPLHYWCGIYLAGQCEFGDAELALTTALKLAQLEQPNDLRAIALIKSCLGEVLYECDRVGEAENFLRETLRIEEGLEGPNSPTLVAALGNLGSCLIRTGRIEEGELLLKRALDFIEKAEGTLSPRLGLVLNNLADGNERTGRYAEAEGNLKRALNLLGKGEHQSRERMAVNSELGSMLTRIGRLTEAEEHLREAVELAERIYGKRHYWYSRALNNLALLLHELNRYEEAESMFNESLVVDEEIFGENHSNVAIGLNNLGRIYNETKRAELAQEAYARALKIYELNYGKDDPRIAAVLTNLGMCLSGLGRLEQAEPILRQALDIDERAYGPNHLEVAVDMVNLGTALMLMEKYALADPFLRRALKTIESILGKDNRMTLGARAAFEDLQLRRLMFRRS